jgi:hypothetical protein
MDAKAFFLGDPVNLAAGLLAVALLGAGAVGIAQRRALAGTLLLLAAFLVVTFLELRHFGRDG